MESEVLKTGMNLIMEKQIIPNPICPNGCIYRLIHNKRIKNENTNYKNHIPPIGLDTQIQDAIEGENEETKLAVQDKKEKVKINLNRIVSINNSPVRECWIKEGNLHYYMANGKGVEYYFPIKYASIEIDIDPEPTITCL